MDNKTLPLVLFSCNWQRILLPRPRLLMTSTARAINGIEKQQKLFNQSYKVNHATTYLWPWGHTHTRIHSRNKSDFKKLGALWLVHAWFKNNVR